MGNHKSSPFIPRTPIKAEVLKAFLSGYDQLATEYLVNGFKEGFRLNFEGPRGFQDCSNLKSANDDPNNVELKLNKEILLGRIEGPFDQQPFVNLKISPLGLVPKKTPNQFRLIHHLSFPHNSLNSVNAGIPVEASSVHYASIDDAIRKIKVCGRGAFLAKSDIESAFRIIPIHPDDHELLGFKWKGKFYFDTCLPMGCSSSCQIFESFSTAVEWITLNKLGCSHVVHVLDDFLFVEASESTTRMALNNFLRVCEHIGIPIAQDKTYAPSQQMEFLGITLDSVRLEARLPQDKLDRCRAMLQHFLLKDKCRLRELQSLIGLLNFACLVITPGRAFLRRLINLTIGVTEPFYHIRLTREVKDDLSMWEKFLTQFNGCNFFIQDQFLTNDTLQLHTDAASTLGYGALFQDRWFNGLFPSEWKVYHISVLEFYPIILSLTVWGHLWKNHSILFFTDNEALVPVINKQTSKDTTLLLMVRWLVLQCLRYNINFRAKHIPGVKNTKADCLSRLQMHTFHALAPSAQSEPSMIPEAFLPLAFFETLKSS